ncbi:PP2C family protein-serine/threonine phosphatase [Streptomyces zhihengii]
MLSLRGLTGSRLLLTAVVGVVALVAGVVAVVGMVLSAHHDEAAGRIETRWGPAVAELGAVRAAAGDFRAAALAGAAGRDLRGDPRQEMGGHLTALRRLADGADTEVRLRTADVGRSVTRWLDGAGRTGTADGRAVFALPAAAAGTDPAEGTYAAVDARTVALAALLERRRAEDVESTAWHMKGVMLYILGLAAALLLAAVVAAVVLQRRYLAPAGALAQDLRRTSSGDTTAGRADPGRRGWLGRLTREADRVRERLARSERASRRDQEALVQVGPPVRGLHEILAARDDPGPGILTAGDVRAAEGLIAGDYLGTVPLTDGTTAVFLGDVCGHGVAAGLLAVRLKSVVMVGLRLGAGLDTCVRAVHHALAGEEERFTTLTVAVLDPRRSTLTWVNAGHEEPFLRRTDGTLERLATTGPIVHPLLPAPPGTWGTRSTRLDPGDLLVLSTDGLTEGRCGSGEEFGEQRVAGVLSGLADPSPLAAVTTLYTAAERFAIDWARDDVSLLAAALGPAKPAAAGPPRVETAATQPLGPSADRAEPPPRPRPDPLA